MKKLRPTYINHVRRLLLAVLGVMCFCRADAACGAGGPDEMKYIIVWDGDGGCLSFPLDEYPRFMYDTDAELINCITTRQQIDIPMKHLHKYTVDTKPGIPASIGEAEDEEGEMVDGGDDICLRNFKAGTRVTVCTADGMVTARYSTDAQGCVTIQTDSWTPGVYIISVNGMSYKIYRRPA